MKKSLFSKLMATYLIITVISYIIVSIFLSIWFYKYYYETKKNTLLNEGEYIKTLVTDVAIRKTNKTDMRMQLSVLERVLGSKITVYDSYGFEIKNEAEKPKSTIDEKDLLHVIKGEQIIKTGDFKDIFSSYKITVGIPVNISETVTYAVFIEAPLDEFKKTLETVYFAIWIIAFVAIILSGVIVYYSSEKILIRPLSKINNTIKKISQGEFDSRIDINSHDEIGELAESFNYMADSIENLEEMRRSFIANVSHELRSPMTSINGFVDGMLDGTIPNEKWERYLNIVNGETKRLIRITNEVLDLARLESGEFSMNVGKFDINGLISECVIKFEDRINQKNIDMKVTLIKDGLEVKGDRDRINQVLTNLLDNAIKFVPQDGTIKVIATPKDDILLVSVFNTGDPIPKEDIKLIWERFHKVDKARVRLQGGVGLGLSIARQILNQHNQTIWAESSPIGNTFTFTIDISE